MTVQKFNEDRQFGVEIEFTGDRDAVAARMRSKGLNAQTMNYTHDVVPQWKLIKDGSCGWEVVSPILKGREGLRQLKLTCEALKEAGAAVDNKCGLHVHHDVNTHSIKQIANIFVIYYKLEKAFDQLIQKNRRLDNNSYCGSLQSHISLAALRNAKTIEQMNAIFHSRYLKVNFQSYVKYGTVEFRQHGGTIDYGKMYNWILLTQQVVEAAYTNSPKAVYKAEYDNLQGMRNTLKLIPAKGADEEIANMFVWQRGRAKRLQATGYSTH